MKKDKLECEWDETGKLKMYFDGNNSSTIRFFPSDKVVSETLAKFSKKTANQRESKRQPNSHPKRKDRK